MAKNYYCFRYINYIYKGAPKFLIDKELLGRSRNEFIMVDAMYLILTSDAKVTTGNHFLDEEVLV